MPMPPPKATTEGPRDRQVFHEMGQIVRALQAQGPQRLEDLSRLVGAPYWEAGGSTAPSRSRSPTGSSSRTRTNDCRRSDSSWAGADEAHPSGEFSYASGGVHEP